MLLFLIFTEHKAPPLQIVTEEFKKLLLQSVNLPAGQYWVQWGMTGSLASGPWCPPVTISGQAVTGELYKV